MVHSLLVFVHKLLGLLALPKVGLPAIFLVSLISSSVLPVATEPVVFGYIKLSPGMFWPGVLAATAGSILGGIILYFAGRGAHRAVQGLRQHRGPSGVSDGGEMPDLAGRTIARHLKGRLAIRAQAWAHRLGPSALLLCWLPGLGDAMCLVAGWLRLPFWPSLACMALAKLGRTLAVTVFLMWAAAHWPQWHL
ncbi:MAG TPA: VTT domain-containing protein [Bordetella sp.]